MKNKKGERKWQVYHFLAIKIANFSINMFHFMEGVQLRRFFILYLILVLKGDLRLEISLLSFLECFLNVFKQK